MATRRGHPARRDIRLLGGVQARAADGDALDIGPAKCQVVLAALALSVGSAVPVSRLVEAVWGDDPPRTAERTLQSYLARLRGALGGGSISRASSAYRLELPAETVDVARFEKYLDDHDLGAALAEWTGSPLAGLEAPGLEASIARLTERWLAAVEQDLARRVGSDPAGCIAALSEFTAAHPFREELWALLMTALYRVGRQADALAAYRIAHDRLAEALGVEPGPRLQDLHLRILRQDPLLDTVLPDLDRRTEDGVAGGELPAVDPHPGKHPTPIAEDGHRGNLPRSLDRLIGRDGELARVSQALESRRLVSLVGPGGIGKTSLALAAASEYAADDDGAVHDVWLIEFAKIQAAADVPRLVVQVLGIPERHGVGLSQSVVDSLRRRRALLVLDNCEHVVDAAADLAALIVGECLDVHILATSRERLGLTHERVITVPPLDPDGSATHLFAERSLTLDPSFDLAGSQVAVREICRRLDGIPLAIELAAARTASLTPDELLDRLRYRIHVLDGTRRSGADRHRTLSAAIGWSYDLLAPAERTVFRRLAIFTGAFDLDAAERVVPAATEDALEVTNALGRLAEQSLVTVGSGPLGRTFRLLEPIREFGRERLDEAATSQMLAERHARWCRHEIAGIHSLIAGWAEPEGVARLAALWPNLRSAFDWACSTGRLDLARELVMPVLSEIVVRSANELGDWAERLLAATPVEDTETRVLALYAAAHRYSMTQDPESYERLLERYGEPEHVLMHHARAIATEDHQLMVEWAPRAAEEFRSRGDHHLAERAEINLAAAWLNLGDLARADARLEELIERYRRQGPPTFVNWTLLLLGYSALFQQDKARAERCFAEGVEIELPPRTHTPSEPLKARAAFRRGEHARAWRLLRDHIDELLITDNMQAGMMDCIEFVTMMASTGRTEPAALVLEHLESSHLLDAPGWRMLVTDAAEVISQQGAATKRHESITDDRATLVYMRDTLDQLVAS
jgi:predicted ATPase/DNA-binding SARP family transcriptional activator